jgi:hypothetical protein
MTIETDAKLKDEIRAYKDKLRPLARISIVITGVTMALAFFDKFPWVVVVDGNDKSLVLKNRLVFMFQLSFIDLFPLIIAIIAVIDRRFSTIAANPMDPRGHAFVERRQRILQNTLEQLIIKLILSLALCTVLRSNELMILPVFTFLFVLGRFTFALGYPNYRSLGMGMNAFSAILVMILIGYRLFIEGAFFQHIKSK